MGRYPKTVEASGLSQHALLKYGRGGVAADVTDILMIGAVFNNITGFTQLSNADDDYLAASVKTAVQHGVQFARKPTIWMVNRKYGWDFLQQEAAGQMAVFCYIPYDPFGRLRSRACDHTDVKQSPLCDVEGIWHERLLKSGVRFAANVYENDDNHTELPTDFVNRAPFSLLHKGQPVGRNRALDLIYR